MVEHAKAVKGKPCPRHKREECGECHGALERENEGRIGTIVLYVLIAIILVGFAAIAISSGGSS